MGGKKKGQASFPCLKQQLRVEAARETPQTQYGEEGRSHRGLLSRK